MLARLLLLLLLLLTGAAQAQQVKLRGQVFQPRLESIRGKSFYRLDDPELQKLIALTSAQLQWSGSGQTLYVYAPGRQTSWNSESDRYSLNGEEGPAPGTMLASPQAMEPKALWFALGLKAFPDGANQLLLPVVTQVTLDETTTPASVVFKFGAPFKYQSTSEGGAYKAEVAEAAWDAGPRQFDRGEMFFEVEGGEGPGSPLVLRAKLWPFWAARVHAGLGGDLTFTAEPRLEGGSQEQAEIKSIETRVREGNEETVIVFDKARPFFWYQPAQGTLQLDLPLTALPATLRRDGWQQAGSQTYPVARLQKPLNGQSFEFLEESNPPTLILRTGRSARAYPAAGTANMAGYLVARGTVVLDPGHGGSDPGCRNRSLGVYEKDVTLDICFRLRDVLQGQGYKVVLTRVDDRDLTYPGSPDLDELMARSDVANRLSADVFVSIHCNASVASYHRGTSVYYWKDVDYELAQALNVLGPIGFDELGTIQNRFAVLRTSNMPAALVETAFLTNDVEGSMLADPKIRQRIAEQLAAGLGRYMQSHGKAR